MTEPRVLLYDLETSPLKTYSWEFYESNAIEVLEETQILCFAYKWLGDKRVRVVGQDDFKGYKKVNDDKNVVRELHKLFGEAHVVIAHNGDQFDQKICNTRFMVHRLGPPPAYKQIDTKKVAKKYSRFPTNKLDHLGKSLELGQKLSHGGFGIWKGCMVGDPKAWKIMKRYNKQDVVLLEQLYMELRPWIDNHPSMSLMGERPESCPKCGGGPMQPHKKRKYAKVGWATQYQCQNCGGYSTIRKREQSPVAFTN